MVSSADDYLPRHVDRSLLRAMESFAVVVIDGPRAVGKTTSGRRIARSVVSLPADLDRLRVDPERTLADLEPPVLIDEWQLAGTDLLWSLKAIVDSDPTPGRFLLAGSVEPATYGPTYPLTGRAARIVMRPMTRAELRGLGAGSTVLARLVDGAPPEPTAGQGSGFSLDDLFTSGFPAPFLLGYAALVAQRAGDEGRDATRLLTTLRVLATLEAKAVPDQRIWEAADINKVTWKAYEDLLARTHLTSPSAAFTSNRLARLTSYPKRYLADVALSLALAEVEPPALDHDPSLSGGYVESLVLQQLRPQVDAVGGHLFHLRTSAGAREVDAVVEVSGRLLAFEVKAAARATVADAEHLAWLRDQQGERFRAGFVVHTGGDTFPLGDRLWALPLTAL